MATVRPSMPSPRKIDTPSGSQVPNGVGEAGQRQAEQEAHQQAEQEPDDGGHELGGRELLDRADQPGRRDDREVRQDREADHDPGDDPGGEEGAGVVGSRKRPPPAPARASPMRPPSAAPRTRM